MQKMLSIFKFFSRRAIVTAIINSQEGTIGDTDKIIESVTESKKVFFCSLH